METKGNPVDSVIQYQLHKKTSGEGGDSFKCNYQEAYLCEFNNLGTVTITQELYDSDIVVKNLVNNDIIAIGDSCYKLSYNITPDIILSGRKIFIVITENDIKQYDNMEYGVNIKNLVNFNDLWAVVIEGTDFLFTGEDFIGYKKETPES